MHNLRRAPPTPESSGTVIMFFFFIVGTHFFSWGSEIDPRQRRCGNCGAAGSFKKKQGMLFITLFFIIPVIPISGIKDLLQCPTCGTKFQAGA